MFSAQTFIFLAFVSAATRVTLAQEPAAETPLQPIVDKIDSEGKIENPGVINERLFIKYFVESRKEHLEIVKNIRKMDKYEKRYKMVSILAENSMNIIELRRGIVEDMKLVPGDVEMLKNITIRNALSEILENCALFGDVILQLPDITSRVLKSQKSWNTTLQWGLKFVNGTRHLLDEPTINMFDLVRQELKLIPRHPNYTNPYWPKNNEETIKNEKDRRKTRKGGKESKKNKGPRMVNIEL